MPSSSSSLYIIPYKLIFLSNYLMLYPCSLLLKIKVNLFASNNYVCIVLFFGHSVGGGKIGSIAILNAFSIIFGIILERSGQGHSRQGLLLTYISQV
jgi:hypothetical protein